MESERLDDVPHVFRIAGRAVPPRGLVGPAAAASVGRDHVETLRENGEVALPPDVAESAAVYEDYVPANARLLVVEPYAIVGPHMARSLVHGRHALPNPYTTAPAPPSMLIEAPVM